MTGNFQHHFLRSRTPIPPDTLRHRYPGKRYHLGGYGIPAYLEEYPIQEEDRVPPSNWSLSPFPNFLHHKTCDPGVSTWRILSLKEFFEGTGNIPGRATSLVHSRDEFIQGVKGFSGARGRRDGIPFPGFEEWRGPQ